MNVRISLASDLWQIQATRCNNHNDLWDVLWFEILIICELSTARQRPISHYITLVLLPTFLKVIITFRSYSVTCLNEYKARLNCNLCPTVPRFSTSVQCFHQEWSDTAALFLVYGWNDVVQLSRNDGMVISHKNTFNFSANDIILGVYTIIRSSVAT